MMAMRMAIPGFPAQGPDRLFFDKRCLQADKISDPAPEPENQESPSSHLPSFDFCNTPHSQENHLGSSHGNRPPLPLVKFGAPKVPITFH